MMLFYCNLFILVPYVLLGNYLIPINKLKIIMHLLNTENIGGTDDKMPLKNYDIFSTLSDEECEEMHLAYNVVDAKKGDYIYFESQYLNKLFFIKDGYIKIGYINNNGEEIIKEILQGGEMFGQFSLERNCLNGEFAQAYKSDVSLCSFTIDNFRTILQKNTSVAIGYTQKVGNRLRKMENRFLNMMHADVKTRLLRFFCDMIETNNESIIGNTVLMKNFLTHDDIARLIGSTRQTVTTTFNEPAMKKLVSITKRQIYIADIKAVKKVLVH